jgi:dipeptidyl aminopeptidase/acylaminoacyl peptidase
MRKLLPAALFLLLFAGSAAADLGYQTPPRAIADLIDVPPTPGASMSPDGKTMMLLQSTTLPGIDEISRPELRLAGMRIDPRTNAPSRRGYIVKLTLVTPGDAKAAPRVVSGLPAGARINEVTWSPDGTRFAFTVTSDDGPRLWRGDPATASASQLLATPLNAVAGGTYAWMPDGAIIARTIATTRGAAPARPAVPSGPVVMENDGKKRPARTNPDLLQDVHDEALLDHYLQSQLVRVAVDGKAVQLGKPGLFFTPSASPDGAHLLVTTLHRPYSYKTTLGRFPMRTEVWSAATGKVEHVIHDKPLQEEVPVDFAAVQVGPRSIDWRDDAAATLCWAEARDGGDPKAAAKVRDEVLCQAAPWKGKPARLAELALRFGGVTWGNGQLALVSEWWWTDRKTRTWIVAPDDAARKPRVLWDRSSEDRYGDPGDPLFKPTGRGGWVMHVTPAGKVLLTGAGASPEGDRPFLDALDVATGTSERLWRSEAPSYARVIETLDDGGDVLLTMRETVTEPPQYFLEQRSTKARRKLTSFPHPNPGLARAQKKLLQYSRADGVKLSGMLYTPPGWKKGRKPLPCLFWAYPAEFKSKDAAGQVQDSPHRFVRAHHGGPLFALLDGYAVLDDPQFPIIGEGTVEPNDSYVPQLIAGAQAAIDAVVKEGVCDRDRIAIGGHSYGAFTTANLLAHSNLFRAGIARSGAYNRTLTPFGFQAEERVYWKARDTYTMMSPFTHADAIDEPLLMIHGAVDDNPGTYPIQSERLFEAMKGLGGRVRLVMLPAETHGYRARESVLHTLWEMTRWLDTHVKKAKQRPGR